MDYPKIHGFNKTSEAGNNIFAPSIFLGGCNFRCPYCMNSKLISPESNEFMSLKAIDINDIKNFVLENKCTMLMISGGEPFMQDMNLLINLFKEILSWGCQIGISTNGSFHGKIEKLIGYIKYVAMDIKSSSINTYKDLDVLFGVNSFSKVIATSLLLRDMKQKKLLDYEFRTTLYPPMIDISHIRAIGERFIKKDDTWILQQFRKSKKMLDPWAQTIEPYSHEVIEKDIVEEAKKFTDNVIFKYV